jgi:hypothetical protein
MMKRPLVTTEFEEERLEKKLNGHIVKKKVMK